MNDKISNLFDQTKLFNLLTGPNNAVLFQKMPISKNIDGNRQVACLSNLIQGHKYLFWIKESTYSYERSMAFCLGCFEYKIEFDGKQKLYGS